MTKPVLIKNNIFKDNRGFLERFGKKKRLNFHANLRQCQNQKKM